jgi:hypothetical protein
VVPIALERDHRRRLLTVRVTGVLTLREALDLLRTATADPAVETWPLIFDARGATTDMTPEDVESAVATVAEIHRTSTVPRGHVAIIADDDQLYVRMLLYETCLSDIGIRSVRAFRQAEAAERWLDIMHAARNF